MFFTLATRSCHASWSQTTKRFRYIEPEAAKSIFNALVCMWMLLRIVQSIWARPGNLQHQTLATTLDKRHGRLLVGHNLAIDGHYPVTNLETQCLVCSHSSKNIDNFLYIIDFISTKIISYRLYVKYYITKINNWNFFLESGISTMSL